MNGGSIMRRIATVGILMESFFQKKIVQSILPQLLFQRMQRAAIPFI